MALCSLGTAVLAWPVLRRCSLSMALLFLALGIANFSTEVAEQTASLSMLSLSQKFAVAAPSEAGLFQGLGDVVAAAHHWAHYMNLIVGGLSMSVFYAALLRFALIPRALAGFGLIAALLLLDAVVTPLFGQTINFMLLAPVGLAQLGVSLWLMARGFTETADIRPDR
jgi:Na+-transporting NADH:ubiquinone oxidoreductase subunit NqrD